MIFKIQGIVSHTTLKLHIYINNNDSSNNCNQIYFLKVLFWCVHYYHAIKNYKAVGSLR